MNPELLLDMAGGDTYSARAIHKLLATLADGPDPALREMATGVLKGDRTCATQPVVRSTATPSLTASTPSGSATRTSTMRSNKRSSQVAINSSRTQETRKSRAGDVFGRRRSAVGIPRTPFSARTWDTSQ